MANDLGNREPKQLPRHARLFGYSIDAEELLILLAADDHMYRGSGPGDPDGNSFRASVATLCAWTKLSKKTIQRRMHGYLPEDETETKARNKRKLSKTEMAAESKKREERTEAAREAWLASKKTADAARYKPGLVDRRIFKMISPGSAEDNKAAMYEFVEVALKEDPRVTAIRESRKNYVLPGFREPRAPGHPIYLERPGVNSPLVPPSVSLTLGFNPATHRQIKDVRPSVSLTPAPSVSLTPPNDSLTLAPSVSVTPPSVSLTHNPMSSLGSSDVEVVCHPKPESETTSSFPIPVEVKKGLREIVPTLDDRAISHLWTKCQDSVPDCTAEEVLHFAWTKYTAIQKAKNPAGMMIHAVALCFEGGESSALVHYREDLQLEQERKEQDRHEKEQREKIDRRRFELEQKEWKAIEAEILTLDQLPPEEFKALRSEVEKQSWVKECWGKTPKDALERMMRREMAKTQLKRKGSNAN
ncbi:MAG TPA: hypothetical protein VHA06_07010 [Candidatus Angelobacter sp.]|jgi:hypothetical protein|nr:hypothetical protein [Candidatus Angelobacter sp.]